MIKPTSEQQRIIDLEKGEYLISAGAGSGKTFTISKRILELVKNNRCSVSQLLILTFTNKAAAEMRERILKEFLDDPELKGLASEVISAQFTTFDSFFLYLVNKYGSNLNIYEEIAPADENIITVQKTIFIDQIFNEYYESNNDLFINFIKDYCVKNDKDLKTYILQIDTSLDKCLNKEEEIDKISKIHLSVDIACDYVKNIFIKIFNIIENLRTIDADGLFDKEIDELERKFKEVQFDPEPLIALTEKKGRNCIFKISPHKKDVVGEEDYVEEVADYNKAIENLKSFRSDIPNVSVSELIDLAYTSKEYHPLIIEILHKLNHKIIEFKKEHQIYTFNDITKLAIKLTNIPHIKNEIRQTYSYIMIDEYQDTSDLQDLFINNIKNNNIFLVGDVKQSIYAFRNANLENFIKKMDEFNNDGKDDTGVYTLSQNRRSDENLINFVNQLFSKTMSKELGGVDYVIDNQQMSSSRNNDSPISYISTAGFSKLPADERDKKIFELIINDIINKINSKYEIYDRKTEKTRPVKLGDFCILLPSETKYNTIKRLFNDKKVPLTIEADEKDYTDQDIIIVLKSIFLFISCINDKEEYAKHKLYFLSIARSFLYLAKNELYNEETIYNMIKNNSYKEDEIYKNISALANIDNTHFDTNISNSNIHEPLVNIFNKIVEIFDFENGITRLGDVYKNHVRLNTFYKLCETFDHHKLTFNDFINYLIALDENDSISLTTAAAKENLDAVKLINIHKSKGLEFKICYYLFTGSRWPSFGNAFKYDDEYGISLPCKRNEKITDPIATLAIKEKEAIKQRSEKLRLLYVALTRAEEEIIILTSSKIKRRLLPFANKDYDFIAAGGFLKYPKKHLIPNDEEYHNVGSLTNITFNLIDFVYKNNPVIIKRASKETDTVNLTKEERETLNSKLNFGNTLHQYLECVDLIKQDTSFIPHPYKVYIDRVLKNDIFRNIDKAIIYKEYEFFDKKQDINGIIDLLLIYDDKAVIIDYKTKHIDDEDYERQLDIYKKYVSSKWHLETKTYLLSIVDNIIKELK